MTGALDSEIRLYDVKSGARRRLAPRGANELRWASTGRHVLAAMHSTICATALVRIDVDSGGWETLVAEHGQHLAPAGLSRDEALFVSRPCRDPAGSAIAPGDLWSLDLASGRASGPGYRGAGRRLLNPSHRQGGWDWRGDASIAPRRFGR